MMSLRYVEDHQNSICKKPNQLPLYVAQIIDLGKYVGKFREDLEAKEFFTRAPFKTFSEDYLGEVIKKHNFELGGGIRPNNNGLGDSILDSNLNEVFEIDLGNNDGEENPEDDDFFKTNEDFSYFVGKDFDEKESEDPWSSTLKKSEDEGTLNLDGYFDTDLGNETGADTDNEDEDL